MLRSVDLLLSLLIWSFHFFFRAKAFSWHLYCTRGAGSSTGSESGEEERERGEERREIDERGGMGREVRDDEKG